MSYGLSVEQAAARLGVKPETLYAYVSRGLVERTRGPDGRSYFRATDIDRLTSRGRRRGAAPVDLIVRSAISTTHAGRLYYRGMDAVGLSQERSFEDVAEFLWTGSLGSAEAWPRAPVRVARALPKRLGAMQRLPIAIAALDEEQWSVDTARIVMSALVDALPVVGEETGDSFASRLWARLCATTPTPELLDGLDLALGLCADHGLIRSTLAARIVCGSGGTLPASVGSALGVATASVAASGFDAARRLLGGEPVQLTPLHPDRYPHGDPRTEPLLHALRVASPQSMEEVDTALARLPQGARHPDQDVALVALEQVAGMRPPAAETIAIIGRAAGWIAHALEEHDDPTPLRVRVAYTGPEPQPPQPARRTLHAVLGYLEQIDR